MSNNYDKYKNIAEENILSRISNLALKQKELESSIAKKQEELQKELGKLKQVQEVDLPELMDKAGQKKLLTSAGINIILKDFVKGHISESNKEKAYKWLDENKFDRLIKHQFTIEFDKDDGELADTIRDELVNWERQLDLQEKKSIHNKTLNSFLKVELEKGTNVPFDLFGIQRIKKTTIKV
jgi:hypothetical protein